MPRSGFVLYTNALWYHVKRLYRNRRRRGDPRELQRAVPSVLRRIARVSARAAAERIRPPKARNRDLFLSFVNFSFFGDEGDVFGNVLAVLYGLTDARASKRTIDALMQSRVHEPYPVRAVTGRSASKARSGVRTWRATARTQRGSTITAACGRWWAGSGSAHLSSVGDDSGALRPVEARPRLRGAQLGFHGVAPRKNACAPWNAGSVLERGGVPYRGISDIASPQPSATRLTSMPLR